MRLLRTDLSAAGHLQLCNFVGDQTPRYAILSHTWGEGEITLQDVEAGRGLGSPGYEKVKNCCPRAKADGFDYVWVDTCCIDKTSSAELSESIKSSDILSSGYGTSPLASNTPSSAVGMGGRAQIPFSESRWFTRGWTLQELIAPSEIIFTTLQRPISARTGIPTSILAGGGDGLGTASVAQKMSWAAKRQTTRGEDTAYCLLGIFGVNMPLPYGEGQRALIRLLFAWRSDDCRGGLLATSAATFHRSGDIVPCDLADLSNEPVTISNRGVCITLPIIGLGDSGLVLGVLSCGYSSESNAGVVGVYLRDTLLTMEGFKRVHPRRIHAKLERLQSGRKMPQEPEPEARIETSIQDVAMERRIRLALRRERSVRNSSQTREYLFKAAIEGDDDGGKTALIHTAQSGQTSTVWLLFTRSDVEVDSARVDVYERANGQDLLSWAIEGQGWDLVRSLLSTADLVEVEREHGLSGRTPLTQAVSMEQEWLIDWLLNKSIDVNIRDRDDMTPLATAVTVGNLQIANKLLQRGTKVYSEGREGGRTAPLILTVKKQDARILKLLLEHVYV
ncbi:ankyrin repeat-containing domain protein [Lasiosphaeris hirsuta]|uniref:Ankyrin repeat-containing domain protein n=1 Tax=Lasiosphaeris hirsuta TaxID=260670 RepID=A0AA39ZS72_9PEZI|nr:ankyrin repeat-containing domain protein [Lasiosphaeris hirsuta]